MRKYLFIAGLLLVAAAAKAQTKTSSAQQILSAAYKQAAAEHKNVLLMFHASWCGWCHKMDSSLNDPTVKKFFTDNYVITHLVVHEWENKKYLENEGADALLKQYKAFDKGIPFWVILDKDGNLLQDTFLKGANGTTGIIGYPANEQEVAAFIKILKATSAIKDEELAIITTVFRKNEVH